MNRNFFFMVFFFYSNLVWAGENYLRDTKMVGDALQLQFKFDVEHVEYFIIPAKGFTKYVYDIKGGVLPLGKTLPYTHPNVHALRIGQYNKETLRIVIESTNANNEKYTVQGNSLVLPLPVGKTLTSKAKTKKLNPSQSKGLRVVIDAGHGGFDNGASCCDLTEKSVTLAISKKLQEKLREKGYRVYMTRKRDKYHSLINRTEYANGKKADIFVSIHANAAPAKKRKRLNGIEIFYLTLHNSKRTRKGKIIYQDGTVYGKPLYRIMTANKKIDRSKKLAKNVQHQINRHLHKGYTILNSDLKRAEFWVLLGTTMPSILVEVGYLTHQQDRKRLESDYYQTLLVDGMVAGIESYFKGQ